MTIPNYDPTYERITEALKTVAAHMKRSEANKRALEPIFRRLHKEKEAYGQPALSLDDMIEQALLG